MPPPTDPSSSTRAARVRENQRRSRARKQEYIASLESRLQACQSAGIQASIELQQSARRVVDENAALRQMLLERGVGAEEIATRVGRSQAADGPQLQQCCVGVRPTDVLHADADAPQVAPQDEVPVLDMDRCCAGIVDCEPEVLTPCSRAYALVQDVARARGVMLDMGRVGEALCQAGWREGEGECWVEERVLGVVVAGVLKVVGEEEL